MPSIAYDFLLDCSVDFDPDVEIQKKADATGVYAAYAGVPSMTMLLSATAGSSVPLHANLSKASIERASTPGWIHPSTPFQVADLQAYVLPSYRNAYVYLNLFKTGDVEGESFTCLVVKHRLDAPP